MIEEGRNFLIFLNGYKFSKNSPLKSGENAWRYILKTCKAKIYTKGVSDLYIWRNGEHINLFSHDKK